MKVSSTNSVVIPPLKILVYGESGAGKTTLAGTIDEPTLIVSAEAGLLCLSGKEIDFIDISQDDTGNLIPKEKRIDRLGEVYKYLNTEEAKKKYKWVFVDSISEISQNMIEQLQSEFPDRKDSLVLYGENSKRMRALVKAFRDLPNYNVVFTALSQTEKDESGQRYIGIGVVGSIADKMPAFFDGVYYLHVAFDEEKKEYVRQLITQKTDKLLVKDRSGKLNKFEPANLGLIAKKIRKVVKNELVKSK